MKQLIFMNNVPNGWGTPYDVSDLDLSDIQNFIYHENGFCNLYYYNCVRAVFNGEAMSGQERSIAYNVLLKYRKNKQVN